mgnify:CR=1 FL=1|jgi:hypothetical protein
MLTTPSRLFKLIIPLTIVGNPGHEKGKLKLPAIELASQLIYRQRSNR